jgi:hypothetical protein
MADLPSIRTKEQIIRDITYGLIARNPSLNDFNTGSVISQFIEAVAQSQFKAYADIINMIDALSVDRAAGEALQRLAADKNVPILPARPSSGKVTITDTSFQKMSSFIYYGQPAPVAGSISIYIVDGSKANPSGGQIYIGRGTKNQEGPLNYTSIVPEAGGAYYKINLSSTSPTTRFHNAGEDVTFSQGGLRSIPAGTEVKTARNASAEPISFVTTAEVPIIDGETTVYNVPVTSKESGKKYNVPKGAIKDIANLSFAASVTNPFPTSNGRDADTDEEIRQRIKDFEKAKSKGTESAIRFAAIGVTSIEEQKTVDSTSILKYSDNSAALVFDDGTGYEPLYFGSSYETIVDDAVGGEQEIQLRRKPLAQARVRCVNEAPYNIIDLSTISVEISGVQTTHQFKQADFRVPSAASSYEIAASVNGNPSLNFSASTSINGTKVVFYPKNKNENNIKIKPAVSSIDANDALRFPVTEEVTLRLYKNDQPLQQDGLEAKISTMNKGLWLSSITSGDTIKYIVDNTQELTVTFTTADFQLIDTGALMNSSTSIDIWAKVFDSKMPGVDANVNGDVIDFSSNRGANNLAKLEFTGGTLVSKIFAPSADLLAEGSAPDYTLNKQTGQIGLITPLSTGDKLTAGSQFTRANIQTRSIESGPSVSGNIWLIIDGNVEAIPNGLNANTYISFTKTGTKLTVNAETALSVPEGFEKVEPNDWILIWANSTDDSRLINNQGFWRVESVQTGEIVVDVGTSVGITTSAFIPLTNRIQIVRSEAPIQKLNFSVNTLNNFADEIEQKLVGVSSEVVGSTVRISTKSFGEMGQIYVIAADQNGETLEFPVGTIKSNIPSHYGFTVTADSEAGFPSFTHSQVGSAISDTEFSESSFEKLGGENSGFIELLSKYDFSSKPKILSDSNIKQRAYVSDFDKTTNTLTLSPPNFMKVGGSLIQENDRYFSRSGYLFDPNDKISVVIDNDNFTKSFSLPISRKITVSSHSSPTAQNFSADDGESSLNLNDPVSFSGFEFKNFKIFRQSHSTLTDGTYAIKVKSSDFGKNGNKYRVGFIYPENSASLTLSHKMGISDVIDLGIVLPVTDEKTGAWDYTTAFTVSKTTTGGKDSITYSYRVGTEPDFSVTGAGVAVGDIAILGGTSSFLSGNKNIKGKVTNVTATEFTIEVPKNSSISDSIDAINMVNDGTKITVTTGSAHSIQKNDRIGLWGTQSVDGINYPFNTTYIVSAVPSTTQFEIATPAGVPGGNATATIPVNSNIMTVTAELPHNLFIGNIVLIDTDNPSIDGLASVFNVINSNQFQVTKHGSALTNLTGNGRFDFQSYETASSKLISAVSKTNDLVTVTTSSDHGLLPNYIVKVDSITLDHWDAGTTYQANQLVRYGSVNYVAIGINSPQQTKTGTITSGSNEITTPSSLTGLSINMGVSGIGIPNGTIITAIDSITPKIILSNSATSSTIGATIKFTSIPASGIGTQWNISTLDLTGTFVVDAVPTTSSFTYYYHQSGIAAGTGGSASKLSPAASLSRCLNSSNNLQFATVSTTAQEVVDYITNNLAEKFNAKLTNSNSTAVINTSTEDLDILTDYISGNITNIEKIAGSRLVKLTSDVEVFPGSKISVSGISGYNEDYIVLDVAPSGVNFIFSVHTSIQSPNSSSTAVSGTLVGSTPYQILMDGENFVEQTDLSSLIGSPQFYTKNQWKEAPELDEEMYLVTANADQIIRFWNKTVVTGLSNVSKIENSEYGRQIQISTQTFGNNGSVKITGGTGNDVTLALVGSTSELNDKLGVLYVPYEIKKGLVQNQWLKLQNQLRQNKVIGLTTGTSLQVYNDGIQITSSVPSTGTFQTIRPTTQTEDTVVKIERHGDFIALISVDGPSFNLNTAGVKEGDWLRIKNNDEAAWSSSSIYSSGARISYNGFNYTSLQSSNQNKNPETETDYWELREFNQSNEGIFQIVRIFEDDSLWIKFDNAVEGMHYLGNSNNFKIYSYDSVMPGDTLVITTDILGSSNVGRYTVVDESYGSGYLFPTSSRIYTTPITSTAIATLGGEFSQINIEEKTPLTLWKRIFTVGPITNSLAAVLVDSPNLVNRTGESLGSYIIGQGKVKFDNDINFGVDAYKYYGGLIKELNKVIYGDPFDSYTYPGVRAAGTDIDIIPAMGKRIKIGLAVRIKSSVPFTQIRERIKGAVASSINQLGAGQQVALSKCIAAASSVVGVTSVSVTYPTYNSSNDQIPVGPSEKPIVIDSNTDITVTLIE